MSKDSSILLLDEPTSNIDPLNELRIMEKVMSKYNDKCIICSVHKLHLLRYFDTVLVFKEGQIVQSGSFKDLYFYNF